ncbi:hypothetical protein CLOBOL_07034 [Enterocloster bolteae ATCC BAA-613]|uniref:Uncharacterized protein n=1 Tax=Enterocloster bolteae (strain ATCC BAA-613 / DSM 15670 / CCUG 46953 / JCM 12243 / WAL 16351) TaxID=411902 RepID=A8S4N9_ENTBW|nr:hypothetical protein CLOBOL_07034 [Enterocloster bolteae ATCC BAA-613]
MYPNHLIIIKNHFFNDVKDKRCLCTIHIFGLLFLSK